MDTELGSVPAEGSNTGTGIGVNGKNGKGEDTGIHNAGDIQVYPEFEGGMKAWAKFIQRNLRYRAMVAPLFYDWAAIAEYPKNTKAGILRLLWVLAIYVM